MKALRSGFLFAVLSVSFAALADQRAAVPFPSDAKAALADFKSRMRSWQNAHALVLYDIAKGDFKAAGDKIEASTGSAEMKTKGAPAFATTFEPAMQVFSKGMRTKSDEFVALSRKTGTTKEDLLNKLGAVQGECSACHNSFRMEEVTAAMPADAVNMANARWLTGTVLRSNQKALISALEEKGSTAAIPLCQTKVPSITKTVMDANPSWSFKRVSLKPRNPTAVPDAWENKMIEEFSARLEADKNTLFLEETSNAAGKFRFAKGLVVQKPCLACHGDVSGEIKAALNQHYPNDRSTGFKEGQLIGIISATK